MGKLRARFAFLVPFVIVVFGVFLEGPGVRAEDELRAVQNDPLGSIFWTGLDPSSISLNGLHGNIAPIHDYFTNLSKDPDLNVKFTSQFDAPTGQYFRTYEVSTPVGLVQYTFSNQDVVRVYTIAMDPDPNGGLGKNNILSDYRYDKGVLQSFILTNLGETVTPGILGGATTTGTIQRFSYNGGSEPSSTQTLTGTYDNTGPLKNILPGSVTLNFTNSADPSSNFNTSVSSVKLMVLGVSLRNATTDSQRVAAFSFLLGNELSTRYPNLAQEMASTFSRNFPGTSKLEFTSDGGLVTYEISSQGDLRATVSSDASPDVGPSGAVPTSVADSLFNGAQQKPNMTEWARSVVDRFDLWTGTDYADFSGFGFAGRGRSAGQSQSSIDYALAQGAQDSSYKEAAIQKAVNAMISSPVAQSVYANYGFIPLDQLFQVHAPQPYLAQGHGQRRNPDAPELLDPNLNAQVKPAFLLSSSSLQRPDQVAFDPNYGVVTYFENTMSPDSTADKIFNAAVQIGSAIILGDLSNTLAQNLFGVPPGSIGAAATGAVVNQTVNHLAYGTGFDLRSLAVAIAAPGATSHISANLASVGITGSTNVFVTRTLVGYAADYVAGRNPSAFRSALAGLSSVTAPQLANLIANGSDLTSIDTRSPTAVELGLARLAVGTATAVVVNRAAAPQTQVSRPVIDVAAADAYLNANPDVAAQTANPDVVAAAAQYYGVSVFQVMPEMIATMHYETHGKEEGRTFGAPLAVMANAQTVSGPAIDTAAADAYLLDNPDVAAAAGDPAMVSMTADYFEIPISTVTPEMVAAAHYDTHGKSEGRTFGNEVIATAQEQVTAQPGSVTTQPGPITAALSPADQYLQDNPDVAAILDNPDIIAAAAGHFGKSVGEISPEDIARLHYELHGQSEGRGWGS